MKKSKEFIINSNYYKDIFYSFINLNNHLLDLKINTKVLLKSLVGFDSRIKYESI